MKVYIDRNCDDFKNYITSKMTIESLIESAVPIKVPEVVNGITYNKCIRIDLMGMCSSLFFDKTHEITTFDLYDQLVKLIESFNEINSKGIFIKIRVLLLYPFCISALTRMYAEISRNRASISEPSYPRDFSILEDLSEIDFWSSSFNVTQRSVLLQIKELQSLINDLDIWNNSKNSFTIRYTPTHININYIQLNNTVFVEPYVYAKESRHRNRCSIATPITIIENDSKCKLFEDNFRYLWQNDVTIVEEDAIEIKNGRPYILPPQNIRYQYKSRNIRKELSESNKQKKETDIDKLEQKWLSYVKHHLVYRFCDKSLFQKIPENIFITCSWITDNGMSSPHPIAEEIKKFFFECIGKDAQILKASTENTINEQVYGSLNESEIAVVLLTKDICDKNGHNYSKPNVYIELGYLLKHVKRENLFIIAESGVNIPSDIQDILRFNYSDSIYTILPEIINNLLKIHLLTPENIQDLKSSFDTYMHEKLSSGLSYEKYKQITNTLNESINKINN